MSKADVTAFQELLSDLTKSGVVLQVFQQMPIPLEKCEICRIFGLSMHEMNREIQPLMEKIGWVKGGRQKIKPYGLRLIYSHFYGEEKGWKTFYTSRNGKC